MTMEIFKVDWVNLRWHWGYLRWTGGVQSDTEVLKKALGVLKVDWLNLRLHWGYLRWTG